MGSSQFSCPACFRRQQLYDALMAPAPGSRGTLLSCAGCGATVLVVAGPRLVDTLLRTRAQVRVERQVREFREALEADEVPSWLT